MNKASILPLLSLCLLSFTAKAQDDSDIAVTLSEDTEVVEFERIPNSAKTVVWGVKGNLNAELPSKWRGGGESRKEYNSGFGVSVGALANIYLGKNFYFEPELALFYEGYSYDKVQFVAPNSPAVNAGPNIYKVGVRVPLVVGYSIDISEKWGINVFTGPQLSYAFWGDVKSDNAEYKDDPSIMNIFGKDGSQRRFDLGWKIGVGFPVNHFVISLEGDIGITDLLKSSVYSFRENRVSLGVAYYF